MSKLGQDRFQNALRDMYRCTEHMEDTGLSDEEKVARIRLVRLCHEISIEYISDGVPNFEFTDSP